MALSAQSSAALSPKLQYLEYFASFEDLESNKQASLLKERTDEGYMIIHEHVGKVRSLIAHLA